MTACEMLSELGQRRAIDAAGNERCRNASRRSVTRRHDGRLAEERLPVRSALASDEPMRTIERSIETEQFGDDLPARAQFAAQ